MTDHAALALYTPKECKVNFAGIEEIRSCSCLCIKKRKDEEQKKEFRKKFIESQKAAFGSDKTRRFNYTFANDDGQTPQATAQIKMFCKKFDEYRKNGTGLLLFSANNGGGKTFLACAAANELIEQGYRVKVTDFMKLRDEMVNKSKQDFFRELRSNALIVIDDLGAEHNSDFMNEVEFRIIDDLTENLVPLILTTNYTPRRMNDETDSNKKRIFDRVLGSCVPVKIDPPSGQSRRIDRCKQLTADFKAVIQS